MEIAIIGGGITGLTTALSLHKLGVKATVYERASELNEIGAGIWLQPNALKICNWLGLKSQIQEKGSVLNRVEITYPNLTPIKAIKKGIVQDEKGNSTIAIHRGELQKILFDEFSKVGRIELGKEYISHSASEEGTQISFSDSKISTDIILGCDGIHSKVRKQIIPNSSLRASGQICWRGVSSFELPEDLMNIGREMWGKKKRFGFSTISKHEVYWFAVISEDTISPKADLQEISRVFGEFHPVVSKMINGTDNVHVAELKDLKKLDHWNKDKVCLLGDAAHATTPNMGQGACQGMEDAYYIAHALKEGKSPEETFTQFEAERRKKVDYVVNTSWTFGKMAHKPLSQAFLRLLMKATPENVLNRQMNKLYHVENL